MRCVSIQGPEQIDGIEVGETLYGRLAVVLASEDFHHRHYALLSNTHAPQVTEHGNRLFMYDAEIDGEKIRGQFPVLREPDDVERLTTRELLVRVDTRGVHRTGNNGSVVIGGGASIELSAQGHSGRSSAESRWIDALVTLPHWGYALVRQQGARDVNEAFAIGHHPIDGLRIYTRKDYARILLAHHHYLGNADSGMQVLLTEAEMREYMTTLWEQSDANGHSRAVTPPLPSRIPETNTVYVRPDTSRKPHAHRKKRGVETRYLPGLFEE